MNALGEHCRSKYCRQGGCTTSIHCTVHRLRDQRWGPDWPRVDVDSNPCLLVGFLIRTSTVFGWCLRSRYCPSLVGIVYLSTHNNSTYSPYNDLMVDVERSLILAHMDTLQSRIEPYLHGRLMCTSSQNISSDHELRAVCTVNTSHHLHSLCPSYLCDSRAIYIFNPILRGN